MRTATGALRDPLARVASAVGPEGAFLIAGTALLAIGSSYLSPVGPLFVVGIMCSLLGLALAIPPRRTD